MRLALAILIVAAAQRPAAACYPAFDRAIVGAPVFEPADAASVSHEDVSVECDEHVACTIVSTFDIAVVKPARVISKGYHITELTLAVDGRAPASASVAPDTSSTVELDVVPADKHLVQRARVAMVPLIDGCFTDGVIARHPYLASAREDNQRVLQIDTTVQPHVKKPADWNLVVDTRAATRGDPATTRLWFTLPGRHFTHGGPVLLAGAVSGVGRTFRLRGGWEAAIGKPWLVFALTGETDFADAWNVALTAESVTKAWVLPLSLGAGGGAVLASGGRIGGRGQISIALGPARVVISVDFVASDSGVDQGVAGLIGGSL